MSERLTTLAIQGAVAVITLNTPAEHNVLDAPLRSAFADACATVSDDNNVRVLMVEGSGGVFAAGRMPPPPALAPPGAGAIVAEVRKPVVAWIDGSCVEMGLELALACDVRVASAGSNFGMRHLQYGLLPWDGGTQRLGRAVGRGQALRLLLTGEMIEADEALRIGLVQQIGDRNAALDMAERMAAGGPIAAAYTKEAARDGADLALDQGLRLEADLSVLLQSTVDRAEGLRSFTNRTGTDHTGPPEFDGR